MSGERFDVIIVGAGPAGIFAALELTQKHPALRILMMEKGGSIEERACPLKTKAVSCVACPECALLSGWGGAGAYSDGKLSLSRFVGGNLARHVGDSALDSLIREADAAYIQFGAPGVVHGLPDENLRSLQELAARNELALVESPVRHIGTDVCFDVLTRMKEHLGGRVEMLFRCGAASIIVENGRAQGVQACNGRRFTADYVVLAPGREGSRWLDEEAARLGLTRLTNPVDIGVRVELPAAVMEHLTSVTYEPKLIYRTRRFDDQVRTFCVNPYGEVVKEHLKDVWTVNGHSYAGRTSGNTNFALLVSTTFTEPFDEPIQYGRHIAQLANFLGRGVIVQRLGDLQHGRRSTRERIDRGLVRPTLADATPGDLSFVLPYRHLADIMEMLEALDRIAPGVNSRHTLLYGVEVKFYSRQFRLSETLETEIPGLFAAGDGAGVSRGLIQASASGMVAAREILARIN